MSPLLLPADVCAVLRCSGSTLKRLARAGTLCPLYTGSGRGTRRYRAEDVEAYLARLIPRQPNTSGPTDAACRADAILASAGA